MMGHNISFYGKIQKIILQLTLLPFLSGELESAPNTMCPPTFGDGGDVNLISPYAKPKSIFNLTLFN